MTTQAVTTRSINVLPVNGNPVTNIDLNQKYKIIVQGLTGNDETLLKNGNYFLKNNTLFSDENCSTTLANLQKGRGGQYRVLVKTELTSSTAIENVALQIVMPEITQAAPAPVVEAPVAAPAPVVEEAPKEDTKTEEKPKAKTTCEPKTTCERVVGFLKNTRDTVLGVIAGLVSFIVNIKLTTHASGTVANQQKHRSTEAISAIVNVNKNNPEANRRSGKIKIADIKTKIAAAEKATKTK